MFSYMMRFVVIAGMLAAACVASQATEVIRILSVGDSITVGYTNLSGQPEVPFSAESKLNTIVQKTIASQPAAHLIVAQTIPYANYTDAIVQYNSYQFAVELSSKTF